MNVNEMRSSYQLKEGETGYNGGTDDCVSMFKASGHPDVCNGHFGPTPEFPDGIYHYHSTMMNGESDMGFPYFLQGAITVRHSSTKQEGAVPTAQAMVKHGIGPDCGGGPGAQLENVELVSSTCLIQ